MWTQRDQIQAYQFLRRRLVSALVSADANHPTSPSRRLIMGTAMGVAAVLLVSAGFGVAGFLHPASTVDWRKGGQVIVEKETGARYVLGQDNRLHPVLNYTSARLLAGGDCKATVTVAASKLAGAPRGEPLGIPGAPDSLPAADRLVTGPWTVCSQTSSDQPSDAAPTATVLVGPPSAGSTLPDGRAVLVAEPSGGRFVVTGGLRYRLASSSAAVALGYSATPPVPVSPAWVSAVPAGPDLTTIAIKGSGAAGPAVGGRATRVGQVLQVATITAPSYYVVQPDGLSAISQTAAALVLGDPDSRSAYAGASVAPILASAAAVAGAPRATEVLPDGYPSPLAVPFAPPAGPVVLCASGSGAGATRFTISATLPTSAPVVTLDRGSAPLVADQAYLPPGTGALVAAVQAPGAPAGTTYLITDAGLKFPVRDAAAVQALGYANVKPTPVAVSLLALFPTAVTLDPAAAQQVVPAAAR